MKLQSGKPAVAKVVRRSGFPDYAEIAWQGGVHRPSRAARDGFLQDGVDQKHRRQIEGLLDRKAIAAEYLPVRRRDRLDRLQRCQEAVTRQGLVQLADLQRSEGHRTQQQ